MIRKYILFSIFISAAAFAGCTGFLQQFAAHYPSLISSSRTINDTDRSFFRKLAIFGENRASHQVRYDPTYRTIDYPGGDVPSDTGVCTDVIIRSYRKLGIDLQVNIHKDMARHFNQYPEIWGLSKPDKNIDHRRVPNMMIFFSRHGTVLPKSNNISDYSPGDLVTWDLGNGVPHIGMVTIQKDHKTGTPLIVHNIGAGPKIENVLFNWTLTGHFRYK